MLRVVMCISEYSSNPDMLSGYTNLNLDLEKILCDQICIHAKNVGHFLLKTAHYQNAQIWISDLRVGSVFMEKQTNSDSSQFRILNLDLDLRCPD